MKMDVSSANFKDILAKLGVLKNNLSLLSAIGIALVAVLLFIPAKILSGKLAETVKQESLRMGSQVKSAMAGAVPRDQGKEVAKYVPLCENDANQIALLAHQSTQRELLSYNLFPAPNDTSSLIFKQFGDRYRAGIDGLLKRVNAGDCPSEYELARGMANASATSPVGGSRPYPTPLVYGGLTGGPTTGVESTIRDELCLSRAKSISVYANPIVLPGYEFWGQYKSDVKPEDAVQDCWCYQLAFWVIEDVVSTIESINSGSADVLTAPVKRLVGVGFGETDTGKRLSSGQAIVYQRKAAQDPAAGKPAYVKTDWSGARVNAYTRRSSNADIDIVHFSVSVVLGAKSVLPFVQGLCSAKQHKFKGFFAQLPQEQLFEHNQITVLGSKFVAVDRLDPYHALYRYGQEAVVELQLDCEYIFDKAAYDIVKPQSVKADTDSKPVERKPDTRPAEPPPAEKPDEFDMLQRK